MRKVLIRCRERQLDLFQPTPKAPPWLSIPVEARRKAISLLARLLRKHRLRLLASESEKEVTDE